MQGNTHFASSSPSPLHVTHTRARACLWNGSVERHKRRTFLLSHTRVRRAFLVSSRVLSTFQSPEDRSTYFRTFVSLHAVQIALKLAHTLYTGSQSGPISSHVLHTSLSLLDHSASQKEHVPSAKRAPQKDIDLNIGRQQSVAKILYILQSYPKLDM